MGAFRVEARAYGVGYADAMRFPEEVNDDVLKRLRGSRARSVVSNGWSKRARTAATWSRSSRRARPRSISVGYRLVVAGMRHCATVPERSGEEPGLDAAELERLFMKLS